VPQTGGSGYLNIKYLAPPEKVLRWIEGKAKLRDWLPYYVSVDQKVYGRFGVLPMANLGAAPAVAPGLVGGSQRLGPAPE
jgi:glycosylphosphatidylinositol transamidase